MFICPLNTTVFFVISNCFKTVNTIFLTFQVLSNHDEISILVANGTYKMTCIYLYTYFPPKNCSETKCWRKSLFYRLQTLESGDQHLCGHPLSGFNIHVSFLCLSKSLLKENVKGCSSNQPSGKRLNTDVT